MGLPTLRDVAEAIREDVLPDVLSAPVPDVLFHYTSPDGLIGIATNKALWATAIRFMNDSMEMEEAASHARLAARNLGQNDVMVAPRTEAELDLMSSIADLAGNVEASVFVGCLSAEGDDLSQWRAYSPPHGGFALGVSGPYLKQVVEAQGFLLVNCNYDHLVKDRIINQFLFKALRDYYSRCDTGMAHETAKELAASEFGRNVSRFGAILKHRSFKAEHEWRVIANAQDFGAEKIRYRNGPRGITPYVPISLVDPLVPQFDEMKRNAFGVRVGPSANEGLAQHAAMDLMASSFGPSCWLGRSDSPYRGT